MLLMCRFRLSWSSMWIPSSLAHDAFSATSFSIKNCFELTVSLLFLKNNGFKFVVVKNHFVIKKPFIAQFNRPGKWVPISTKLWADVFLMQKKNNLNTHFKNWLNYWTLWNPQSYDFNKSLLKFLIQLHCLRFLEYV